MNEQQRLFLDDAQDIVEKLYDDLEHLRVARFEGRRRRELAAQIFRRVHTLKGSAASLGFSPVSEIAHQFEAVLDGARLGRIELADDILDAFETAVNAIEQTLHDPADESAESRQRIVARLAACAELSRAQSVIAGGLRAALPSDIAGSLSEYDLQHAREAIREGAKLFIVSAGFAIESFDRDFRELTKLLGQGGEVIATIPGRPANDDEISFRIVYAADFISGEVLRQASLLGRIEHSEIELDLPPPGSGDGVSHSRRRPTEISDQSAVRVELAQLEDLISAAGELARKTNNTLASVIGQPSAADVDSAAKDLRMRFVAFEERLIKLRLVPVGEVLQRAAARAGRLAARHQGKEIEFTIEGSEVGIEKSLADIIADPLLHLVRNAITHGIETPEERRAAGKNPTGQIVLAASNHSGRIHIIISDDGRGIDLDRVIETAADQGISSAALSEDQCLRLIFRPGFSTAREISDLAGRGIGLDVVDRAMDIAGGEVRVATEKGKGTTFALIIPAALSLVKCVIVRCGDQLYAIDSANVQDSSAAASSGTSTLAAIEPQNLPLVHLKSLIDDSDAEPEAKACLLWRRPSNGLGAGNGVPGYRIGVDEVVVTQETLIRGLGRHAYRWVGICGATEMFDGTVALVLDLPELIRSTLESPA